MNNFLQIDFINGKFISLLDKTINFNDLIIKNYAYQEKIKFIALNCFLDDEKAMDKLKFKIEY